MEDHQGDFKSIKVIKFNNKKEDWTVADEREYDEILEGIVNVPRDRDVSGGEASAIVGS